MAADPPDRDLPLTAAAGLFLLSGAIGVAFGIVGFVTIGSTGTLPGVGGIRFWGDAGFEALWGVDGVRLSLIPWAVLGVAEAVAGWGLWRSRRWAGVLGLALTPFALVFVFGYGAPFAMVVLPLRVALLVAGWGKLEGPQGGWKAAKTS